MYLAIKQGSILNEDTSILQSSRGVHSLRLNSDAVAIVKAIGQAAYYDDALAAVARCLQDASGQISRIKPGFDAFLDFLDQEGFLEKRSGKEHRTNFRVISQGRISRLFIELLSGCNLTCAHCYAHHAAKSYHLRNVDRLLEHMTEAVEYGVHKIDLTGGEVFIFPDFNIILAHLSKLNVPVNLYSNLTLLDDARIGYLKEQSIASVITSIDALTPEVHDRFRGQPFAWQKTVNNVRKLVEEEIPVRVNIVPTNETLHEIKPLCDFLYNKIGVTNIVIGTLFDVGRQVNSHIKHVAQGTISELVAEINIEVFERNLHVWERNNVSLGTDIARPGCGVGRDMLFLSSWGEYAYCPILTSREAPQFAIGNFYEQGFSEIAERFLATTSAPSCSNVSNCNYGVVCQGGCRARAFHSSNDLTAPDRTRCDFWIALGKKSGIDEVV